MINTHRPLTYESSAFERPRPTIFFFFVFPPPVKKSENMREKNLGKLYAVNKLKRKVTYAQSATQIALALILGVSL